ncbi:hypothetical protein D3C85_1348620 [compost metagenome]
MQLCFAQGLQLPLPDASDPFSQGVRFALDQVHVPVGRPCADQGLDQHVAIRPGRACRQRVDPAAGGLQPALRHFGQHGKARAGVFAAFVIVRGSGQHGARMRARPACAQGVEVLARQGEPVG